MLQQTSPHSLVKRTLIVLGIVALIQPIGVVRAFAQETPKKEDVKKQPGGTSGTAKAHHGTSKKGTGKKASNKKSTHKKGSANAGKTPPPPDPSKKEG